MCDTLAMYITNIEKEGPFLKIWGQVDKKAAIDVERALFRAYAMYEDGKHLLNPGNLLIGVLCCAKYIDEKYYRARITNVDTRCQGTVEVNFIDYGNRDLIPIANLRSMDCFNSTFITLPPLALPFILSEVVCVDGEWNDINLEHISREIRYMEVKYKIVSTHLGYQIILIYLADRDLAAHLVQNSLMQSIPLETQESLLSKMIPRTPQVMPPADQSLLQYKSVTLEPNSRHEVYVSYITDGPCHFSVQLKKSESILVQLMREINSIPLKPFEELPIPGTVCLAKCVEDSHICRAVITSEVDNQYKLFYVDFGNTEIVPPDNLYQMPFKYIIPKIMAIRLSLDGVDKSTVTLEMQCAFKQFVDNRLLMMEVFPSPKKMALPRCRMWDPATNTDVMEILNKAAQLAYPNAIALHRGFTRPVKVTFVYSCNKFHIHLKSNEDELSQLMANIQVYCNSVSSSFLEEPKIGQPCCAQFQHDGQWYRSLIIALNEDLAKVKYIDYGNEDDVSLQSLKTIEGEFLTCMRPQAIECCLNGYQNMTEDLERDNKLEELILDQEFTMKVIDIVSGKSLVDLIDSEGRSVTALLMEAMINQTKIQVVANGNFEHNTTKYGGGNSVKKNGKPYGEEQWSRDKSHNRNEKSEDWRQGPRKRNGSMSTENNESWRHKNSKNDSEWHDNTSNESFRKGKTNNESRKSANTNLRYDGKYRNNRNDFRNQSNNWNPPEKDKNSHNHNSYTNSQNSPNEWNGKEGGNSRNKSSSFRQDNEGFGNKENRNKPKNDNWGTDNSSYALGENEEFQGVKKRTKNFSANNSNNRNRDRTDNEEWGNKKNTFNGNDFNEKKSYRDRNLYDSDSSSYKKGRSPEKNFEGKPRYDRGDNRKKPFKRDNDYHTNDREQTDGRKFNSRSDSKWTHRNNSNESRTNSYNNSTTAIDSAPNDATFQTLEVNGRQKVTLSWFHNPCSFFCQLMDSQQKFSMLMEEIQELYKDKPSSFAVEGAPAIALFPEDNVFYRSRILKSTGNKYKVYYVDFGNISVVDSVWPIDKKFMELPMQAIPCGLGGIQPVGNDWPDPNAFVNYMQKDTLDCEFQSYEVDRYMVNLYSNEQVIKQQLVDDNLAKYVEISVPEVEFDINFLVGQTFRAMLTNVKDLSDFRITLSCGIEMNCSAHNLSSATETFEEELKEKINQVVIVYGDNAIDDRLEVTVYDHIGNKLNILNPDEGAYDNVEPICPYLLIQSKVVGIVSFVSETSIVIQPSECTELLETLLNEIYEHYESLSQETPIIPEEGFIYAVLSADSNWYRGRVTSFDDEKVSVTYIDYGNSEDVPFANLRELDSKFYWFDRMAILVEVNVPTAELLEKKVTALVHYGEVGFEAEILDVEAAYVPEEGQQPENDNVDPEINIPNQTAEIAEAEITNDTPIPVSSENESDQSNEKPIVGGTAVVISHIDSPSDFYIQLAESQNAISDLQSKIQEQIGEMPVLENTSIGGLCAAPYSVDQMWYRSQILDADEDITTVRFIDYGNTDVIDNKATQIKTLPAEFLALEEYARRCRLKIKPLEEEWSKPTTDRFEELAYAENVTVEFVNQDEKANYVELFSDSQNVKDLLIAENLAVLDEGLVLDAKLKGYISHMNSPSEFWVQLDGWCAELEWIAEQLSNASSFPDLEDFTPGSLCAAMFPDDEMWYRARILSNTVAGLEVLFLDYGNSCVCGNLKQLPEHLVMAPPLALKCSLQKPEGLFNWSPEAVQKFSEISADGQTEFTLKKLTTGETSLVELYVNNEEVSSKLLPMTEDVHVTDIESMDSFAISKDGTVSDERYRLEKIPGCEYNEECLSKFAEINNEGKTCYGMECLSDNTIRLYLNGNDLRHEFLQIFKDKPQPLAGQQSDNLEGCDTQAQENYDVPQKDTAELYETPQETEIYEESTEVCHNPLTNEIYEPILGDKVCGATHSEESGVPQDQTAHMYETAQEVAEILKEVFNEASQEVLCDNSQENEIHIANQEYCYASESEKLHDVSEEEISPIYETLQAKSSHVDEETSQFCEKSPEEENREEILDDASQSGNIHNLEETSKIYGNLQHKETHEENKNHEVTQENTSKICDTSEVESIHDFSQKEIPQMYERLQEKYINVEEEASEFCETSLEKENLEEVHEVASEVCQTSLEKENFEDASKVCDASQSENIHKLVETSQVYGTLPDKETHVENEHHEPTHENTSKICKTSEVESIHVVSQEEKPQMCKRLQHEDTYSKEEKSSEIRETKLELENREVIQEDISKVCDSLQRENIKDVSQEESPELCETRVDNDHEARQKDSTGRGDTLHTDEVDKSPLACDISQMKESVKKFQEDAEVSEAFRTSKSQNITYTETSQNCDIETNETTEVCPQREIDAVVQKDESCDNQIEDNLEGSSKLCDTNLEDIHEIVKQKSCELKYGHEQMSAICDMKNEREDTTSPLSEILLAENCEISQAQDKDEAISENCNLKDEKEVTSGASTICDIPQVEEKIVLVQEVLEVCDTHKFQEEIKELDEETEPCDKLQIAVSTEVCDIPKDILPIDSKEETEAPKVTSKLEFTETIMTSFSTPTVSEKASVPKLSPTKFNKKVPEGSEDLVGDSSKLEG